MSTSGLRNWCFTTFNLQDFVVPDTNKHFRYCIYQTEECPDTGAWHYQGYIEFTRTMRMKAVKTACKDMTMHLEPRQGSREQARNYCRKEDTRVADPCEFGTWDITPGTRVDLNSARLKILSKRKHEECYDDPELDCVTTKYPRWVERIHSRKVNTYSIDIILYPWQVRVFEMLKEEPVHRRIIWIWSSESNTGKTTFKEWISLQLDVLPASGKLVDILYAFDNNQVIWFDFTRAQQGYESYQALEELSNIGYKLSTKYNSVRKFIRAHIVVTSNHAPDTTKLPDRFLIIQATPQTRSSTSCCAEGAPPRIAAKPADELLVNESATLADDIINTMIF